MSESMSYTAYQQGTYLHHALKEGGGKRTFQVILHFAVPIAVDASETWLEAYPPKMRISREAAQQAVEQTRIMDERNTKSLREKKLLSERTNFLQEVERLAETLACHQRNFVFNVEKALGHRPTIDDLDELNDLGHPLQSEALMQQLRDATRFIEPIPQPPRSWAISDETSAQWKAELPQGPVRLTAEEKDARERAEYRGYRNLIESVERSHRRGSK